MRAGLISLTRNGLLHFAKELKCRQKNLFADLVS